MAKTAAQASANWNARTSSSGQAWVDGLTGTTKPIVARAVAQRQVMVTNFTAATQAGGTWERNLEAVGDAGIKQAARDKQANFATGTAAAQGKFASAIGKIIAYENAGLPTIYAMPAGNTEAGVARASAWIRYMAAGKGQLGA
jgi:hypothetical protein